MEEKKTESLVVKLTPKMKRVVISRAEELGQRVGEYVRYLILRDVQNKIDNSHLER